jgi:hypothetical protein
LTELAAACEVWKEITFNFPTIDKLDGQELREFVRLGVPDY